MAGGKASSSGRRSDGASASPRAITEELLQLLRRGNTSAIKRWLKSGVDVNGVLHVPQLDRAWGYAAPGPAPAPSTAPAGPGPSPASAPAPAPAPVPAPAPSAGNWPLLVLAAAISSAGVVEAVLKGGADPNARNRYGLTALLAAVHNEGLSGGEKLVVAKLLHRHGFALFGAPCEAQGERCTAALALLQQGAVAGGEARAAAVPLLDWLLQHESLPLPGPGPGADPQLFQSLCFALALDPSALRLHLPLLAARSPYAPGSHAYAELVAGTVAAAQQLRDARAAQHAQQAAALGAQHAQQTAAAAAAAVAAQGEMAAAAGFGGAAAEDGLGLGLGLGALGLGLEERLGISGVGVGLESSPTKPVGKPAGGVGALAARSQSAGSAASRDRERERERERAERSRQGAKARAAAAAAAAAEAEAAAAAAGGRGDEVAVLQGFLECGLDPNAPMCPDGLLPIQRFLERPPLLAALLRAGMDPRVATGGPGPLALGLMHSYALLGRFQSSCEVAVQACALLLGADPSLLWAPCAGLTPLALALGHANLGLAEYLAPLMGGEHVAAVAELRRRMTGSTSRSPPPPALAPAPAPALPLAGSPVPLGGVPVEASDVPASEPGAKGADLACLSLDSDPGSSLADRQQGAEAVDLDLDLDLDLMLWDPASPAAAAAAVAAAAAASPVTVPGQDPEVASSYRLLCLALQRPELWGGDMAGLMRQVPAMDIRQILTLLEVLTSPNLYNVVAFLEHCRTFAQRVILQVLQLGAEGHDKMLEVVPPSAVASALAFLRAHPDNLWLQSVAKYFPPLVDAMVADPTTRDLMLVAPQRLLQQVGGRGGGKRVCIGTRRMVYVRDLMLVAPQRLLQQRLLQQVGGGGGGGKRVCIGTRRMVYVRDLMLVAPQRLLQQRLLQQVGGREGGKRVCIGTRRMVYVRDLMLVAPQRLLQQRLLQQVGGGGGGGKRVCIGTRRMVYVRDLMLVAPQRLLQQRLLQQVRGRGGGKRVCIGTRRMVYVRDLMLVAPQRLLQQRLLQQVGGRGGGKRVCIGTCRMVYVRDLMLVAPQRLLQQRLLQQVGGGGGGGKRVCIGTRRMVYVRDLMLVAPQRLLQQHLLQQVGGRGGGGKRVCIGTHRMVYVWDLMLVAPQRLLQQAAWVASLPPDLAQAAAECARAAMLLENGFHAPRPQLDDLEGPLRRYAAAGYPRLLLRLLQALPLASKQVWHDLHVMAYVPEVCAHVVVQLCTCPPLTALVAEALAVVTACMNGRPAAAAEAAATAAAAKVADGGAADAGDSRNRDGGGAAGGRGGASYVEAVDAVVRHLAANLGGMAPSPVPPPPTSTSPAAAAAEAEPTSAVGPSALAMSPSAASDSSSSSDASSARGGDGMTSSGDSSPATPHSRRGSCEGLASPESPPPPSTSAAAATTPTAMPTTANGQPSTANAFPPELAYLEEVVVEQTELLSSLYGLMAICSMASHLLVPDFGLAMASVEFRSAMGALPDGAVDALAAAAAAEKEAAAAAAAATDGTGAAAAAATAAPGGAAGSSAAAATAAAILACYPAGGALSLDQLYAQLLGNMTLGAEQRELQESRREFLKQVLAMDATWRAICGGPEPSAAAVVNAARAEAAATASPSPAPTSSSSFSSTPSSDTHPAAASTPSTAPTAAASAASATSSASSTAPPPAPRVGRALEDPEALAAARRQLLGHPVLWPAVQAVARLPAAPGPHPHSRVLWDDDNTPIYVLMSLAARRAVEAAAALGSAQHS
ncbi:hypothetical protein HYH03_007646 [Edaphochlamys debaryana]|uniref:Uncharacterized protein n=1 Tax=Edaphochlamys debaryana TaxID=47281 RepID=A0A836C0A8_9CHLO|nr:hypothetical protein HYH03_007646 [Edaphochlamys debaryana]|eukprot:KAG2494293.1 hypothetical protein HYH03_007646 [Edaphochlamys debaryana]